MWPSVAVTTVSAVWGWFWLLWLIVIVGPCVLAFIVYRLWYRPLLEREFKKIVEANAKAKDITA